LPQAVRPAAALLLEVLNVLISRNRRRNLGLNPHSSVKGYAIAVNRKKQAKGRVGPLFIGPDKTRVRGANSWMLRATKREPLRVRTPQHHIVSGRHSIVSEPNTALGYNLFAITTVISSA
jgi:hypothetical protein